MTDSTDDLIKRLKMWVDTCDSNDLLEGACPDISLAADALEALKSRLEAAERAAEGLRSLLREVRDAYMQDTRPFKLFGKAWNLRGAVDAALAQEQWQPCGHDDPSWCTDKCVPPWKRAEEQKHE